MRLIVLAWGLALVAPLADAEPIYRCGRTYSQTPCTGGRMLESSDPRTAAQRAEARRVAQRERQKATQKKVVPTAAEAASAPKAAASAA